MVSEFTVLCIGALVLGLAMGVIMFAAMDSERDATKRQNTFISQCVNLNGVPVMGDTDKCIKDGSVIFSK